RIQAICKSDRFKELHKQKYPRYGNYLREENYIVPNYMPNQKQISERRRLILTSWMFEVTVEFRLWDRIFLLAVRILDLYSSKNLNIQLKDYQCLGCVCLYLSILAKTKIRRPDEYIE